jgi:hypothetical protein
MWRESVRSPNRIKQRFLACQQKGGIRMQYHPVHDLMQLIPPIAYFTPKLKVNMSLDERETMKGSILC